MKCFRKEKMSTIWIIAILMVSLFSHINFCNAYEVHIQKFTHLVESIKGEELNINSKKIQVFILYSGMACSKCVHQLADYFSTFFPQAEIFFITTVYDNADIASKRSQIDYIKSKYCKSADVLFTKNKIDFYKELAIVNEFSLNLIISKNGELKYFDYNTLFPKDFSPKQIQLFLD